MKKILFHEETQDKTKIRTMLYVLLAQSEGDCV